MIITWPLNGLAFSALNTWISKVNFINGYLGRRNKKEVTYTWSTVQEIVGSFNGHVKPMPPFLCEMC